MNASVLIPNLVILLARTGALAARARRAVTPAAPQGIATGSARVPAAR